MTTTTARQYGASAVHDVHRINERGHVLTNCGRLLVDPAAPDRIDKPGAAPCRPCARVRPEPAARPAPRYVGSIPEAHGEVLTVDDCDAPCCYGVDPWDQPHATLRVRQDADGAVVKLQRVRFDSFTGRP